MQSHGRSGCASGWEHKYRNRPTLIPSLYILYLFTLLSLGRRSLTPLLLPSAQAHVDHLAVSTPELQSHFRLLLEEGTLLNLYC